MLLLDSNIFIYSVLPEYKELREWIIKQELAASEISLVEVLGYHRLTSEDEQDLRDMFSLVKILPVSRSVVDIAIELRQQRKMSVGDALIAATAVEYKMTLVTRNTSDFDWIEALDVLNPL